MDRNTIAVPMPHALAPGSDVAGYRIESLLGEGATGAVYLARDAEGRAVALKVLDPAVAADSRFRERFLRESRVAALLEHPSVVPVLDAGEDDGLLYIAMEWVDGVDLRSLLRREGHSSPSGPSRSSRTSPPRSTSRTPPAWSIATSSRRTSSSPASGRGCATSGSPGTRRARRA